MQWEQRNYEEQIDLVALIAEVLRKWKWLIAAAVVGAVLLGGVKFLKPASTEIDQEQVTAVQNALNGNRATLAADQTELETNRNNIEVNEGKIDANEELIVTYRDTNASQKEMLSALEDGLDRAQDVLSDRRATAEELSEVIVQLPTLTNDITTVNNQLNATAQQISAAENEIASWKNEIRTMTDRNEVLEQAIDDLEAQIAEQESQLAVLQQGTVKKDSILTFALLGVLLGVIVVCGVVFLGFILDKKMRSSADLKERYQLAIFGELYSKKAKGRKGFARKLDKLAGDVQTLPDEEEVYRLIAAGVQAAVKGPCRLAVTGTVEKDVLEEVSGKLQALLPETFQITAKENPAYNAAFLAEIRDYSVLLVEAKGVSEKPEILRLMEILGRNEVHVLGAVVR